MEASGIDLSRCVVNTDFGRGFYTTTLERQARHWAWIRFYSWRSKNPTATGNQPVTLRFRVRRYSMVRSKSPLNRGLDSLTSLTFVRGDYQNEDYWSLVQHCRQSTTDLVHDHKRSPSGWYDLVSGPVAAFWEQRVAMNDSDQFSFHTEAAVRLLNALIQKGRKTGLAGDPEYYTWVPVI